MDAALALALAVPIGYCSSLKEIDAVRAAGFDYVELRTSEVAALADADFEKLAADLKWSGPPVPVTYLFIPPDLKLTGPSIDEARQTSYLGKALDRVARLGTQTVVFGSGPARRFPDGFSKEEAFRQLVAFCKRLGPPARARGITIATVDFYHLAEEGESPAVVVEAGRHVRHLHMANPQGRVFPRRWEEYDYAGFFASLRQIGYAGRMSIEGRADDFPSDAPPAIAFLRGAFAR